MAQRKRSGYVVRVKAGPATVNIHGKTKKKAVANGRAFVKKYMKNIEQGFYAGGVFHPIRGSSDYSPSRAGEGRKKAKSKGKKKSSARRRR
jgi:hypothetical protein